MKVKWLGSVGLTTKGTGQTITFIGNHVIMTRETGQTKTFIGNHVTPATCQLVKQNILFIAFSYSVLKSKIS